VPLCIESSGHEKLDEERRANVITLLGEWEIPFDPNMVVVCTSPPLYGGLQGIEADIIHENMLRSTTSKGSSDGGGNGGGGSSESGITTGGFGSTGGGFGSG
jgi:uncharacterized membrane protein YgcG